MAYIKVDHSKFEDAASKIDDYVKFMKNKMMAAQGEVDKLSANWQGSDFTQFKTQWNKTVDKDSTYTEMAKSLEQYAKYLRCTAQEYKKAQANAVNRANNLPRW